MLKLIKGSVNTIPYGRTFYRLDGQLPLLNDKSLTWIVCIFFSIPLWLIRFCCQTTTFEWNNLFTILECCLLRNIHDYIVICLLFFTANQFWFKLCFHLWFIFLGIYSFIAIIHYQNSKEWKMSTSLFFLCIESKVAMFLSHFENLFFES